MIDPTAFVHESSYVDEGATIGANSKVWHFCHVMPGAVIGSRCNLGQNVVVMNGVKVVGPTRTAAMQFLVPALAVVLAAVFLDEPIRAGQVVGGVVIVAGVLLTRWQPRRTRAPAP